MAIRVLVKLMCKHFLASFPGHSQILSRNRGEKSGTNNCEIKSGSGLGMRLSTFHLNSVHIGL